MVELYPISPVFMCLDDVVAIGNPDLPGDLSLSQKNGRLCAFLLFLL